MSVLIKGMEMPKSCGLCRFDDYGYCTMVKQYSGGSATHGIASFCPLVELPEKHGRLIDADELEELFRELIGSIAKKPEMTPVLEHMVRASAMVVDMIEDASTVIEAEGTDE